MQTDAVSTKSEGGHPAPMHLLIIRKKEKKSDL